MLRDDYTSWWMKISPHYAQDFKGAYRHLSMHYSIRLAACYIFMNQTYCLHTAPSMCINQHATQQDQHKIIIPHVLERNDCKWSLLRQIFWLSNKTDQNSLSQGIFLEFWNFSPTYTNVTAERPQLFHCPRTLKKPRNLFLILENKESKLWFQIQMQKMLDFAVLSGQDGALSSLHMDQED